MAKTLTIEVDGPHNEALAFAPLQRRLRGRFDAARLLKHDDGAGRLAREWPDPIPGQRLRLDLDAQTALLIEPLHDAEHAALRDKITAQGHRIAAPVEEFAAVDVATWAYWLRRAVASGHARVIDGKLPENVAGTPRLRFLTTAAPDPVDQLTAAIDRQTAAFEKLTATLTDALASRTK